MLKICVLEVCAFEPSLQHHLYFKGVDLYFVSYKIKSTSSNCLGFYPKSEWSETRNYLYENVPKKYDYYMFIDDDIILNSNTNLSVMDQIINDLQILYPAQLSPAYDREKLDKSYPYYKRLFSNNCCKIYHKSILNWVLPYNRDFGGGWSACHFINFLEISFQDYIITTTNISMSNPISSGHDKQKNNQHKINMENIWLYIKPAFRQIYNTGATSLDIKQFYQNQTKPLDRLDTNVNTNFLKIVDIRKYFDVSHPYFKKYRSRYI